MSRKRKTAKAAPIKLIWLERVIEQEWPDKPARPTIVAIAAALTVYGDRAGRGICPAVGTIAAPLRIKRQTVIDVLRLMVAEGMLAKKGKTAYGTVVYDMKLAAKPDDTDAEAVPQAVPHSVTHRGTQSSSLDRKGERDDEHAPTPAAEAAVAGNGIEPSRIEGDEADQIITNFITAFDSAFAARDRSKTVPTASLEPSHPKLRAAIIAKHEAAWPTSHLIERTLKSVTNDEKKINNLAGVVASILSRLPAEPDHDARKAIEADKVAAEAKRTKKEKAAAKAKAEKAEAERRESERLVAARRRLSNDYQDQMARIEDALIKLHGDTQADSVIISTLAGLGITNPDADIDELGDDAIRNYTARLRAKANELQKERERLLDEFEAAEVHCRRAYFDRHRAHHEVESDIDSALAAHGINRDTMRDHNNIATATRLHRELGDKIAELPIPRPEQKVEMW